MPTASERIRAARKSHPTFEVQFKDGLGVWRRWTHQFTWDAAHSSRRRCREYLGEKADIRIRELS